MDAPLNRLEPSVVPTHYDLVIRTDLRTHTFDGLVTITLTLSNPTSSIVLNARDIELGDALLAIEGQKIPVTKTIQKELERVALDIETPLAAGTTATIRLPFRGDLGTLVGYFKSEWEHEGVKSYYAATFFEPTSARRTFPCFDEPNFKAAFTVSLISRQGLVNLSNMPAVSEGPFNDADVQLDPSFAPTTTDDNWIITRFATTPKMSTYILGFACGPFEYTERHYTSALSGRTVPVRIYATPDIVKDTEFGVDLAAKVLPMLEDMFKLEYPLPKLDLVCATGPMGALENWGIIIGEPGAFLFNPETGATTTKKRVVDIISHELAHQWFGDIVTMAWWDNLWLNEGYATLLGGLISERLYPEWRISAHAVNLSLARALTVDAKLSSHSVQLECPDANDVHETLDMISYMKGCSVLRMLLELLGEQTFFDGVSLYLKNHLYSNSVPEDLWTVLGTVSGTDVLSLMNNWILATGYPVLTVTEVPGGINIRQNRFLAGGPAAEADDTTLWTIPLNIATVGVADSVAIDKTQYLSTREAFISIDTSKPLKLNAGSTGFYRVLYGSVGLNSLALAASRFDVRDRVGMMNDAIALAKAGLAPVGNALTLIEGFAGDDEYLVLDSIAANISSLSDSWWENDYVVSKLKKLDCSIFKPIVDKLGYEYISEEASDVVALRTLAVKRAASAGDPSVVAELLRRFQPFLAANDKSSIPPDLQMIIFKVAVQAGGRECYEKIWTVLRATKSPEEEMHTALAIGSATDPSLISDTFARLLGESEGNMDWLMHSLTTNPSSRRAMAQFLKDNYDVLLERFDMSSFSHYSQQPFRLFTSQADYDSTDTFFQTKDTSKYTRPLQQTLEIIRGNIQYLERSTAEVLEWLQDWEARHA